ncbi:uncharacterized protein F5147DRAFT_585092, partial [Suillus discolor]
LQQFELADNEWEIAGQLYDILKILKDTTLFFSRSTPNLATVIPAMDLIDDQMTKYSRDTKYSPLIHAAVQIAKKTLDRYYQMMDKSEVYRIAMVLHPRHKLAYFKSTGWEEDWVTTAETLVREEFEHAYQDMEIEEDDIDSMVVNSATNLVTDTSCEVVFFQSTLFYSLTVL